MKICMISSVDLGEPSGVLDHVLGVAGGLAECGHEVTLITRSKSGETLDLSKSGVSMRAVLTSGYSVLGSLLLLAREAISEILENPPDIVYLRNFPLDYLLLTRRIARSGIPCVCEINTITDHEYAASRKAARGRLYAYFEGKSLRYSVGWLPVTHEIADYARRVSGTVRPIQIARNGVQVPTPTSESAALRLQIRQRMGAGVETCVILMAGFTRPWHGFDRVIEMMTRLGPEYTLWLLGSDPEADQEVRHQLERCKLRDRVHTFPWMQGEELHACIYAADLGLGPMAMERKDMIEAQPIEIGVYLAGGLCVLINYEDLRFKEPIPFVKRVAGYDPKELAAAVKELAARAPALREEARRYAMENLTWSAIAKETGAFLAGLIDRPGRNESKATG